MTLKSLQADLLTELGRGLSTFGFGAKAKGQSFYRPFGGGRACAHVAFIDHEDDFDITMDVAVRFDQVEDFVNARNDLITAKEKKLTCTFGVELGNLSTGEQRRWTVTSSDDLSAVVPSMLAAYEQHGEPYLREFSSLEGAYTLLCSDERSAWMHSPFHGARAQRAIAIASLLGHEDLPDQITRRREFLQSRNDFGLAEFNQFAGEFG